MKTDIKLLLIIFLVLLINGCSRNNRPTEIFLSDVETLDVSKTIVLPPELSEISGIVLVDSLLVGINDSGNSNTIFAIDPQTGAVISRTITPGVGNHDWEEITYSPSTGKLLIGDFGNNGGNRKDLAVVSYEFSMPAGDSIFNPEIMRFSYADQNNFLARYWMHQWDCEAMVVRDSTISLFSKNWKTQVVYQYDMPAKGGGYLLEPVDSLKLGILVTGAALDPVQKRLVFCGYFANEMYLVVLNDYSKRSYLDGRFRIYRIPALSNRQVESVTFYNGDIILATEATIEPQALFILKLPISKAIN